MKAHTGKVCCKHAHKKKKRLHNTANLSSLIKDLICSMQEGCMKPGDKLLAVNGESVLGYTVEKVRCATENEL